MLQLRQHAGYQDKIEFCFIIGAHIPGFSLHMLCAISSEGGDSHCLTPTGCMACCGAV